MVSSIDERVTELEKFYVDIPDILNLRFARVDAALKENAARFDEVAGRLNLLDTQMGMIIRDVRDLRGGVTRQLGEQDKRLARMESDHSQFKSDVAEIKVALFGHEVARCCRGDSMTPGACHESAGLSGFCRAVG